MKLAQKIAKIRRELKYTEKRGFNAFHRYNYVMAEDIAAELGKTLAEHNIIIRRDDLDVQYAEVKNAKNEPEIEARVVCSYILIDGDSDDSIAYASAGAGRDKGDKAIYKAWTGAFKYFFIQAFSMPLGADPEEHDGQAEGGEGAGRVEERPPAAAGLGHTSTGVSTPAPTPPPEANALLKRKPTHPDAVMMPKPTDKASKEQRQALVKMAREVMSGPAEAEIWLKKRLGEMGVKTATDLTVLEFQNLTAELLKFKAQDDEIQRSFDADRVGRPLFGAVR